VSDRREQGTPVCQAGTCRVFLIAGAVLPALIAIVPAFLHRRFRGVQRRTGWYTGVVLGGIVGCPAGSASLDTVDLKPVKEAENDCTADFQQHPPP